MYIHLDAETDRFPAVPFSFSIRSIGTTSFYTTVQSTLQSNQMKTAGLESVLHTAQVSHSEQDTNRSQSR